MRDEYIYKFYNEVNQELEGDYKILWQLETFLKL